MRTAACGAALVLACAFVVTAASPAPAEASSPALTLIGASSGAVGSLVTYAYSWDVADCIAAGVSAGDTVILVWQNPQTIEPIGVATVAIGGIGGDCTGTVSGRVPGDATVGNNDVSTAYLQHASLPVAGSEATANHAFRVTAAPTPTPRPTPRPTPSARPSISPRSAARRAVSTRDPKGSPATTAGVLHSADAGPGGPPSTKAVLSATAPVTGGPGFLAKIPGGWFGLGIFVGVGLLAAGAVAFLTLERRRFARMYPKNGSRRPG